MKHRRTDPACMLFRTPTTRLGWWRFNRARGRGCTICVPPLREVLFAMMAKDYAAAVDAALARLRSDDEK